MAEFQVSVTTQDGEEVDDTTWNENGRDNDGWTIGHRSSDSSSSDAGLIFAPTIPQGATILTAYASIYAKFQGGGGDPTAIWKGIDEDDTAVWSSGSRPSQRTHTAASVSETGFSGVSDESWFDSVSLVSIVQEIVARGGWSSGNNLGLVLLDNGSSSNAFMQFNDYTYSTSLAAKLTVTWSTGNPWNYYAQQ